MPAFNNRNAPVALFGIPVPALCLLLCAIVLLSAAVIIGIASALAYKFLIGGMLLALAALLAFGSLLFIVRKHDIPFWRIIFIARRIKKYPSL